MTEGYKPSGSSEKVTDKYEIKRRIYALAEQIKNTAKAGHLWGAKSEQVERQYGRILHGLVEDSILPWFERLGFTVEADFTNKSSNEYQFPSLRVTLRRGNVVIGLNGDQEGDFMGPSNLLQSTDEKYVNQLFSYASALQEASQKFIEAENEEKKSEK